MTSAKRELLRSPDVCELAQLQPYVLRSWEAEFPGLGQVASTGGRVYRQVDVDLVLRIKQLVFVEGLTLAGARRRLEEEQAELTVPLEVFDDSEVRARLREVRGGLEAILQLLNRGEQAAPELQLVAPSASGPVSTRERSEPARGARAAGSAKGGSGRSRRVS